MNDKQHFDLQPEWVGYVRTSAEITLAVASGVLGVLNALERHRQLDYSDEQDSSLLLAPLDRKDDDR